MRAPRARARSSSSSTSVPAPSPTTRPSRRASNGRGVALGASLRVDVASRRSKTAASIACSSSAPPAIITSCAAEADRLVARSRSPWLPDVHALAVGMMRPRTPKNEREVRGAGVAHEAEVRRSASMPFALRSPQNCARVDLERGGLPGGRAVGDARACRRRAAGCRRARRRSSASSVARVASSATRPMLRTSCAARRPAARRTRGAPSACCSPAMPASSGTMTTPERPARSAVAHLLPAARRARRGRPCR